MAGKVTMGNEERKVAGNVKRRKQEKPMGGNMMTRPVGGNPKIPSIWSNLLPVPAQSESTYRAFFCAVNFPAFYVIQSLRRNSRQIPSLLVKPTFPAFPPSFLLSIWIASFPRENCSVNNTRFSQVAAIPAFPAILLTCANPSNETPSNRRWKPWKPTSRFISLKRLFLSIQQSTNGKKPRKKSSRQLSCSLVTELAVFSVTAYSTKYARIVAFPIQLFSIT